MGKISLLNRLRGRLIAPDAFSVPSNNETSEETAFTVLELLVAVTIIGVLSAISVPVVAAQQRAAIDATVKSDVKSNSTVMSPGQGWKLYTTPDVFDTRSAATDENVLEYFVNPTQTVACVQGTRTYSEDDVTAYHFLSSVGYIQEGLCPELGGPEGTGGTGGEPGEPGGGETTPPPSTDPGLDDMSQMAGLRFFTTYAPQTNSLNFCWTIRIEVDPDYPHEHPDPTYMWEYKTDISAPPFWGLNPLTNLNSTYGYQTKNVNGNVWTMRGEGWNDTVRYSTPRTVGFCTTTVPEPPLNPATYNYVMTPSPSNSQWWACLDFVVTSHLEYPTPWRISVDLADYFQSIQGRTPQFINLQAVHINGTVHEVTGIGWNQYVADQPGMQRIYSTAICYDPQGNPW